MRLNISFTISFLLSLTIIYIRDYFVLAFLEDKALNDVLIAAASNSLDLVSVNFIVIHFLELPSLFLCFDSCHDLSVYSCSVKKGLVPYVSTRRKMTKETVRFDHKFSFFFFFFYYQIKTSFNQT